MTSNELCKGCVFFGIKCYILIDNNTDCPCSTCLLKSMCTKVCQNLRDHVSQDMDDKIKRL